MNHIPKWDAIRRGDKQMLAHNTANKTYIGEKPVQIPGILEQKASEGTVNTGGERDTAITETIKAQGSRISFQTDYTTVCPSKSRKFFGAN